MKQFQGVAASRGIGIGPVFQFRRAGLSFKSHCIEDVEAELQRLEEALKIASEQIARVYEKAQKEATADQAEIFQAQLMMVEDPEFMGQVRQMIRDETINAEAALAKVAQAYSDTLRVMDDEYFAARALDVQDVANRILRILLGVAESPTEGLIHPAIIFADDLSPSDTVLLDKRLVLGFCTAQGSATSHTAILARSLGLPAVAGAGPEVLQIQNGTQVIVDGDNGTLLVEPSPEVIEMYKSRRESSHAIRVEAMKHAFEPAVTRDGKRYEVSANVGNIESSRKALENGAEGIGLLRTEFLYLERQNMPGEEEQYQAYKQILDLYKEKPVILRTLDIGGDKELPYLEMPKELNPFLGLRAIRLCMAKPNLLKAQLRAALRAGVGNNLWIMYPMVATANEVRAANKILQECQEELKADGKAYADAKIGIMVEIPSAAINADQLAKVVDFFSIGTNDLSQYTMAADRTNPLVENLSDAFQPAVLRLIRNTIQAAHAQGKWVGMCGELAGEPEAVPILVGLELDEFSVNPPVIPLVKQIIRSLDSREMKELAKAALDLESPDEIKALVRERVPITRNSR